MADPPLAGSSHCHPAHFGDFLQHLGSAIVWYIETKQKGLEMCAGQLGSRVLEKRTAWTVSSLPVSPPPRRRGRKPGPTHAGPSSPVEDGLASGGTRAEQSQLAPFMARKCRSAPKNKPKQTQFPSAKPDAQRLRRRSLHKTGSPGGNARPAQVGRAKQTQFPHHENQSKVFIGIGLRQTCRIAGPENKPSQTQFQPRFPKARSLQSFRLPAHVVSPRLPPGGQNLS